MNYTYNDNELIYLISEDSEQYRNILFDKYKSIIYSIANSYFNNYKGLNIDYNDLVQEALIGFNNAINSYKEDNTLFYTYAILCIKRNIVSYIRTFYYKKNIMFNNTLDDSYYESNIVFDDDIFISSMYEYEYINIKNSLSNTESMIFELRYNGFSIKEISKLLGYNIYKINRIICKIKCNLKKQTNLYL